MLMVPCISIFDVFDLHLLDTIQKWLIMSLQFLENALENNNVKAFLLMLRHSEGTSAADGYNYLFGSSPSNDLRFTDLSHHPDKHEPFRGGYSSAAGAYQILYDTWETIQAKYNLPDFSQHSQDIACVELISERNALQVIMNGDFNTGLHLCGNIWASLPGNNYKQPQHSMDQYIQWYTQAGGVISNPSQA